MKDSSDTIGNRAWYLLACITVPQPTARPCAQNKQTNKQGILAIKHDAYFL